MGVDVVGALEFVLLACEGLGSDGREIDIELEVQPSELVLHDEVNGCGIWGLVDPLNKAERSLGCVSCYSYSVPVLAIAHWSHGSHRSHWAHGSHSITLVTIHLSAHHTSSHGHSHSHSSIVVVMVVMMHAASMVVVMVHATGMVVVMHSWSPFVMVVPHVHFHKRVPSFKVVDDVHGSGGRLDLL